MGFYDSIAAHYHEIFPARPPAVKRLQTLAGEQPVRMLDVACGTGEYAAALADRGHTVFACDLDQEMVRRAAQKPFVKAFRADMLKLSSSSVITGLAFDVVYCIGNSIVHLPDESSVSQALHEMYAVMDAGGRLLLQVINYDRVLDTQTYCLPTIRNEQSGLTFSRRYVLQSDGRLSFITQLTVAGENEGATLENRVPLLPLRSSLLKKLVLAAGFSNVSLSGNFNLDPFDPVRSEPLVLTAKKNGCPRRTDQTFA